MVSMRTTMSMILMNSGGERSLSFLDPELP
jgi:hypothetical protein